MNVFNTISSSELMNHIWDVVYLVKSAIRCNASVCCSAGSSSNSVAVKECPEKSTRWSKAPILWQSDSAVDWNCVLNNERSINMKKQTPSTKEITKKKLSIHQFWVTLLSPVTTITRMPAVMQESMAFLTSSLGGSSIPTLMKEDGGEKSYEEKKLTEH